MELFDVITDLRGVGPKKAAAARAIRTAASVHFQPGRRKDGAGERRQGVSEQGCSKPKQGQGALNRRGAGEA